MDLPVWARRVMAKPAPITPAIEEEPEGVDLPAWAARRLSRSGQGQILRKI